LIAGDRKGGFGWWLSVFGSEARGAFACLLVSVLACSLVAPTAGAQVMVEQSQFEPHVIVRGPAYGVATSPNTVRFLRSFIDRQSGIVTHQLYVRDAYRAASWRSWEHANDEEAHPLELVPIFTDVDNCSGRGGCAYVEEVGVVLPDSGLRGHPAGYAIKLYARNGESLVVPIADHEIAPVLRAVDSIVTTIMGGR
jgi:hypothetical protein